MSSLITEHQVWPDSSGAPIVNGFIHIGTQNADPTLTPNKITIYSDRDLSVPLSNPQRTDANGRSVNKIWVPGRYSITVQDSASAQKYSELDAGESAQTGISNLTNIQGVDTITADGSPTITALIDQEIFTFRAIGTVTGAVTLQIDTTDPWPVKKYHDQALVSGDIEINQVVSVMWNETDSVYELQSNPSLPDHIFPRTVKLSKGADIASANDLVLLNDGNNNDITGTTTINGMTDGILNETRKFHFVGDVLLKHDTAPAAGFSKLFLPGEVDYTTSANDEIEVTYDDVYWRLTGIVKADGTPITVEGQGIHLQTEIATTSGTTKDFTSIPSWVKKITIMFDGVSTDGTLTKLVQIGDSGGFHASGYVGSGSEITSTATTDIGFTTGFGIKSELATDVLNGAMTLTLMNAASFKWVAHAVLTNSTNENTYLSSGVVSLDTVLTQVRITSKGSPDTFNAGSINILYE